MAVGLLGDPLGEARATLRAKLRGSGVPTEASWALPPFGGAVTIYDHQISGNARESVT